MLQTAAPPGAAAHMHIPHDPPTHAPPGAGIGVDTRLPVPPADGAPRALGFAVVACSGWDEESSPHALAAPLSASAAASISISTSPTATSPAGGAPRGWQTPRFCTFPQHLVLRLEAPARVRRIQILSHHFKIATRIDIYTGRAPEGVLTVPVAAGGGGGGGTPDGGAQLPPEEEAAVRFEKLGFITLSDNVAAAFRARELKTIHVDVTGVTHLRFSVGKCHVNPLNLYNQVGIAAISVFGTPVDMLALSAFAGAHAHARYGLETGTSAWEDDPRLLGIINRPASLSGYGATSGLPGAGGMGMVGTADAFVPFARDEELRELLRGVVQAKEYAIREERYAHAKALKQLHDFLIKQGPEVAALEAAKARAVQIEDYDQAERVKQDILRINASVRARIANAGIIIDKFGNFAETSAQRSATPSGHPLSPPLHLQQLHQEQVQQQQQQSPQVQQPQQSSQVEQQQQQQVHQHQQLQREQQHQEQQALSNLLQLEQPDTRQPTSTEAKIVASRQAEPHRAVEAVHIKFAEPKRGVEAKSPLSTTLSLQPPVPAAEPPAAEKQKSGILSLFSRPRTSSSGKKNSANKHESLQPAEATSPPVIDQNKSTATSPEPRRQSQPPQPRTSVDLDNSVAPAVTKSPTPQPSAVKATSPTKSPSKPPRATPSTPVRQKTGVRTSPSPAKGLHQIHSVDDEIIPTLRASSASSLNAQEAPFGNAQREFKPPSHFPSSIDPPSALSPRDEEELAAAVEAFGGFTVACVLSKTFALREWGANEVKRKVEEHRKKPPKTAQNVDALVRAIAQVAAHTLDDPREKLATIALSIWSSAAHFAETAHLPALSLYKPFEQIVPSLVTRCTDSNTRVREAAEELAPHLATLAPQHLPHTVKPLPKRPNPPLWRNAKFRLDVIARCVEVVGIADGFGVEAVMGFTQPLLGHPHNHVRDACVRVVTALAKRVGVHRVEPYFANAHPMLVESIRHAIGAASPEPREAAKPRPSLPRGRTAQRREGEGVPEGLAMPAATAPVPKRALSTITEMTTPRSTTANSTRPTTSVKGVKGGGSDGDGVGGHDGGKTGLGPNSAHSPTSPARDGMSPVSALKRDRTGASKSRSPTRGAGIDTDNSWNVDRTCIFCNEVNEAFTQEYLDQHYWSECPMLTSCPLCQQIVEIAALTEHLLGDCARRSLVKECPRCSEAVLASEFKNHVAKKACKAVSKDKNSARCPLCHRDITASGSPNKTSAGGTARERAWRKHLLVDGCPASKRKRNPKPSLSTNTNAGATQTVQSQPAKKKSAVGDMEDVAGSPTKEKKGWKLFGFKSAP